jgi:hypothetical protein
LWNVALCQICVAKSLRLWQSNQHQLFTILAVPVNVGEFIHLYCLCFGHGDDVLLIHDAFHGVFDGWVGGVRTRPDKYSTEVCTVLQYYYRSTQHFLFTTRLQCHAVPGTVPCVERCSTTRYIRSYLLDAHLFFFFCFFLEKQIIIIDCCLI